MRHCCHVEDSEFSNARSRQPLRPLLGDRLVEILRDHATVEVEVGTGKGLFLAETAPQHPDRYYVGWSWLINTPRRRSRSWNATRNTQTLRSFAPMGIAVMSRKFPAERLHAVHVTFQIQVEGSAQEKTGPQRDHVAWYRASVGSRRATPFLDRRARLLRVNFGTHSPRDAIWMARTSSMRRLRITIWIIELTLNGERRLKWPPSLPAPSL